MPEMKTYTVNGVTYDLRDPTKAPAGYGLGTAGQLTNDWNTAMLSGFYYGKTNSPDGGWWAGVVYAEGSGYAFQHLYKNASTAQKVRECNNGTWGAWVDVSPSAFAPASHTNDHNNPHGVTVEQLGLPNLCTYRMIIPANGSVRFSVNAQMLMFGGVQAVNHKPAIYVFHGYATIRQPYVHELSPGHLITVATGGNNTDGWYVEITSSSSGSNVVLYFIGNTIPGIIA